jgi:acyl-CoA synthetase (AMP-forming)/AMP-acid ligase II
MKPKFFVEIFRSLRNSHDFLVLTPNDTVFGVLPYFHAGGLLTLFCMLAQRAKVIINRKFSEEEFLKTIEKYQVTKIFFDQMIY